MQSGMFQREVFFSPDIKHHAFYVSCLWIPMSLIINLEKYLLHSSKSGNFW